MHPKKSRRAPILYLSMELCTVTHLHYSRYLLSLSCCYLPFPWSYAWLPIFLLLDLILPITYFSTFPSFFSIAYWNPFLLPPVFTLWVYAYTVTVLQISSAIWLLPKSRSILLQSLASQKPWSCLTWTSSLIVKSDTPTKQNSAHNFKHLLV